MTAYQRNVFLVRIFFYGTEKKKSCSVLCYTKENICLNQTHSIFDIPSNKYFFYTKILFVCLNLFHSEIYFVKLKQTYCINWIKLFWIENILFLIKNWICFFFLNLFLWFYMYTWFEQISFLIKANSFLKLNKLFVAIKHVNIFHLLNSCKFFDNWNNKFFFYKYTFKPFFFLIKEFSQCREIDKHLLENTHCKRKVSL